MFKKDLSDSSSIEKLSNDVVKRSAKLNGLKNSEDIVRQMTDLFKQIHGRDVDNKFFSPGRVNLIGDHIDYNGGSVFPCALTLGTYAVVSPRDDRRVSFCSLNYPQQGIVKCTLDDLSNIKSHGWTNYAKGMISVLADAGYPLQHGFDSVIYGNIPTASGLSSSASLELLYGVIVRSLGAYSNDDLDGIKLAKLAQKDENEFIGVNCGIMDQFAIAMGRDQHAILLNTDTLAYEYAPLKLDGQSLIIANTNKKRGLADSKYNERRSECEAALKNLQTELNIDNLCEIDLATLQQHRHLIADETCYRRARHAVNEQQHVVESLKALAVNDLEKFGELMNKSHNSLRDDYEVTGIELDTLVENARKVTGCLGARVTGAGFGGCTVNLVKTDSIDKFIDEVGAGYHKAIGYSADFYIVSTGDGARELK